MHAGDVSYPSFTPKYRVPTGTYEEQEFLRQCLKAYKSAVFHGGGDHWFSTGLLVDAHKFTMKCKFTLIDNSYPTEKETV